MSLRREGRGRVVGDVEMGADQVAEATLAAVWAALTLEVPGLVDARRSVKDGYARACSESDVRKEAWRAWACALEELGADPEQTRDAWEAAWKVPPIRPNDAAATLQACLAVWEAAPLPSTYWEGCWEHRGWMHAQGKTAPTGWPALSIRVRWGDQKEPLAGASGTGAALLRSSREEARLLKREKGVSFWQNAEIAERALAGDPLAQMAVSEWLREDTPDMLRSHSATWAQGRTKHLLANDEAIMEEISAGAAHLMRKRLASGKWIEYSTAGATLEALGWSCCETALTEEAKLRVGIVDHGKFIDAHEITAGIPFKGTPGATHYDRAAMIHDNIPAGAHEAYLRDIVKAKWRAIAPDIGAAPGRKAGKDFRTACYKQKVRARSPFDRARALIVARDRALARGDMEAATQHEAGAEEKFRAACSEQTESYPRLLLRRDRRLLWSILERSAEYAAEDSADGKPVDVWTQRGKTAELPATFWYYHHMSGRHRAPAISEDEDD